MDSDALQQQRGPHPAMPSALMGAGRGIRTHWRLGSPRQNMGLTAPNTTSLPLTLPISNISLSISPFLFYAKSSSYPALPPSLLTLTKFTLLLLQPSTKYAVLFKTYKQDH